jgi:hypothetical protein
MRCQWRYAPGGSDSVTHCVALNRALYLRMGVGDGFVEVAVNTAKQTTTPITMPRFPAVLQDALTDRCKSDGAQLDDLAALVRLGLRESDRTAGLIETTSLTSSFDKVEARRAATGVLQAGATATESRSSRSSAATGAPTSRSNPHCRSRSEI